MTREHKAVVVGLGSVTGLQTARILSDRGVRVVGLAGDRRHFGARTRVCELVLESDVHGEGFVGDLEELGPRLGARGVLFPCTDNAVLAVSRHRARLERWYDVVLGPDALVRTLVDKTTFSAYARSRGLLVPDTFVLTDRSDAQRAAEALLYPAVLKPAVKSRQWKQQTSLKAYEVSGPAELLAAYDRLRPWSEALVAQQYVPGGDDTLFTCNCYVGAEGHVLVTFVTRKCRQWPPHLGTASCAHEWPDEEVAALTGRFFSGSGFRGLGYLELKRDPRTGRSYAIEANVGRPTGRSATAEAAGVELLYTMYCDAAGLPLPPLDSRTQTGSGAVWLDLRRDALSGFHYWRQGELSPLEWARSVQGPRTHAVLSARDPLPFVLDVAGSLARSARRLRGRTATRLTGSVPAARVPAPVPDAGDHA